MMLAHDTTSLPAAAVVTPTQRQAQAAHVERQRRLGLVRGYEAPPVVVPLPVPPAVTRRAPRLVAPPVLDATDLAIIERMVAGDGPKAIALALGLQREMVKHRIYRKSLRAVAAAKPVPARAWPTGTAPMARAMRIVREVAARHRLAETALLGGTRVDVQVMARDEAIGTIRAELGWSLKRLGRLFGGRHHTTILQALQRWQMRLGATGGQAPVLTPGERAIVDAVAARHGLAPGDMLGCTRQTGMRAARAELCWRLHHECGWAPERLTAALGRRDPKGAAVLVRWHARQLEAAR